MILSASRRTDIPGFYAGWLMDRLAEGYALVPNPRFPKRLSQVSLTPDDVELMVLWSKNPAPMLPLLDKIPLPFYFQYTLNPYGAQLEPGVPPLKARIATFQALSRCIGPQRVDWRYDPVIIDANHSPAFHLSAFEALCGQLAGHTTRCILSFVDRYRTTPRDIVPVQAETIHVLAQGFARIAQAHSLSLMTCAEPLDLSAYGIGHAACIDPDKVSALLGYPVAPAKDPGQRPACHCLPSVDIGAYDTCGHGCTYCYATHSQGVTQRNRRAHDPHSPLITGPLQGDEVIIPRAMPALKPLQITLL